MAYNKNMLDIIIIGAGVTGVMLARKLARFNLDVLVIDKENDVGNVTSNANSAIIHSGYDPLPNTLKAKLNVLGAKQYPDICKELDVAYKNIGTLTIINHESQLDLANELISRAKINGVKLIKLNKEEAIQKEPNLSKDIIGALYAPEAGIVNPFELVVNAMENAVDNGVNLHLNEEVIDIKRINDNFKVVTNKESYDCKVVINAAGLYADKIANLIEDIDWSITPRKGEYFVFDHKIKDFVHTPLFPLPSEKGKGILFAPTTSGNYYIGPSSELILDKDDVSTDSLTLAKIKKEASLLIPNLPMGDVIRVFAGVRATCTRHDFVIEPSKKYFNFINVGGIESPGFASSPAIADYVIDNYISKLFNLDIKKNYNPYVKKHIKIKELNKEELNELIKKNPEYGQIICNCEQISLGEIKDTLSRSVAPTTFKGVKKRTRAGFGKCQGGYCSLLIYEILANHYHKDITEINYDKNDSPLVIEEIRK